MKNLSNKLKNFFYIMFTAIITYGVTHKIDSDKTVEYNEFSPKIRLELEEEASEFENSVNVAYKELLRGNYRKASELLKKVEGYLRYHHVFTPDTVKVLRSRVFFLRASIERFEWLENAKLALNNELAVRDTIYEKNKYGHTHTFSDLTYDVLDKAYKLRTLILVQETNVDANERLALARIIMEELLQLVNELDPVLEKYTKWNLQTETAYKKAAIDGVTSHLSDLIRKLDSLRSEINQISKNI